uniref:Uncharacterized protein n=1 Tax=Triticum urartu TaxID=4572 RepID=A0A8R7JZX0_TRIUA
MMMESQQKLMKSQQLPSSTMTLPRRVPPVWLPLLPCCSGKQGSLTLLLLGLPLPPLLSKLLDTLLPSTPLLSVALGVISPLLRGGSQRLRHVPGRRHALPGKAITQLVLFVVRPRRPNLLLLLTLLRVWLSVCRRLPLPSCASPAASGGKRGEVSGPTAAREEVDVVSVGDDGGWNRGPGSRGWRPQRGDLIRGAGGGGGWRWGTGRGGRVGLEAPVAAERDEAGVRLAAAGGLALELVLAGGLGLVDADLLLVVEPVDVPPLLRQDVQPAVPAHLRLPEQVPRRRPRRLGGVLRRVGDWGFCSLVPHGLRFCFAPVPEARLGHGPTSIPHSVGPNLLPDSKF